MQVKLEKVKGGETRVLVSIKDLREDPANARMHPPRNMEVIKDSLKTYGQQKPIVVDKSGMVLAGNGTLRAVKELGWEEVWVAISGLEGIDRVAYAIADNRSAELARWYDKALVRLLHSMQEQTAGLVTGFSSDDLQKLVSALGPPGALLDIGQGTGEEDPALAGGLPEGLQVSPSHVRMVQLFLTTDTFMQFQDMARVLGRVYGTDNVTDTCIAALRNEFQRAGGNGAGGESSPA